MERAAVGALNSWLIALQMQDQTQAPVDHAVAHCLAWKQVSSL